MGDPRIARPPRAARGFPERASPSAPVSCAPPLTAPPRPAPHRAAPPRRRPRPAPPSGPPPRPAAHGLEPRAPRPLRPASDLAAGGPGTRARPPLGARPPPRRSPRCLPLTRGPKSPLLRAAPQPRFAEGRVPPGLGARRAGVGIGQLASLTPSRQPGFWLLRSARGCFSLQCLLSASRVPGATRIQIAKQAFYQPVQSGQLCSEPLHVVTRSILTAAL